jgi:alpha-beta hydrolase superfamily lysophospholipase
MTRVWSADTVLPSFESTTIELQPEDDGPLVATLVRRKATGLGSRAVLYVHGFIDYFFQEHVADAFNAQGWDFYAIDLRRYGRSLRGGNRPNYCRNITEYYQELTAAIDIIKLEDEHETLLLMGHSTGGLIASLYADNGERCDEISGLVLNSPFLAFSLTKVQNIKLPIAAMIGKLLPFLADKNSVSARYVESISKAYDGEWEFDERWKPLRGFPTYYGWANAIRRAHARIAKGLTIECPVLALHSSHSMFPAEKGDPRHKTHDIVLDVSDIRELAPGLGTNVTVRRVENGVHDLFLSPEPVRSKALGMVFSWILNALGEKKIVIREFRT